MPLRQEKRRFQSTFSKIRGAYFFLQNHNLQFCIQSFRTFFKNSSRFFLHRYHNGLKKGLLQRAVGNYRTAFPTITAPATTTTIPLDIPIPVENEEIWKSRNL
jgi:hypothetical protein